MTGGRPFTIAFVGDLMIGRDLEAALKTRTPESYWGPYLSLLRDADLTIANLECPITQADTPWKGLKTYKFRAAPHTLAILKAAKIALVNLANNHTGDYQAQGLLDTLAALRAEGIAWCGAGRTLEEARQPTIIERRSQRIAVAGFSDRMPEYKADATTPGHSFAWPPKGTGEVPELLAPFAGLDCDLRIVSAHWGADLLVKPLPSRRRFARSLIEGGIDVIHGHSSHKVHGVERIQGKPVLYDCGNTLQDFWIGLWPWTQRGAVFLLEIGPDSSRLRQIPVLVHDMRLSEPGPVLLKRSLRRYARQAAALGNEVEVKDGELVTSLDLRLPRLA